MVDYVEELTSVDVLQAGEAEVVTNQYVNLGVEMVVNVYLLTRVNVHVDTVVIIVNKVCSSVLL